MELKYDVQVQVRKKNVEVLSNQYI